MNGRKQHAFDLLKSYLSLEHADKAQVRKEAREAASNRLSLERAAAAASNAEAINREMARTLPSAVGAQGGRRRMAPRPSLRFWTRRSASRWVGSAPMSRCSTRRFFPHRSAARRRSGRWPSFRQSISR